MHHGVARLSTGLGYPHLETDPDFLGPMAAFQTKTGQRVDFLAINDPASPTDDHRAFITLLEATAASAGAGAPFAGNAGQLDLLDLTAVQSKFALAMVRGMGMRDGVKALRHVLHQTLRTARSSTALQTYWTGVVEIGGTAGKFVFVPTADENPLRACTRASAICPTSGARARPRAMSSSGSTGCPSSVSGLRRPAG